MDKVRFLKSVNTSWKMQFYLFWKLPAAWFMGIRVVHCDHLSAKVRLPYSWRSQNPFRSIYFAAQCAAAELSTGLLGLAVLQGQPAVSMLVLKIEADFLKKAAAPLLFVCEEGEVVEKTILKAVAEGDAQVLRMCSIGYLPDGTEAAKVWITWSFKRKKWGTSLRIATSTPLSFQRNYPIMEEQYEALINGLLEHQYGTVEAFIPNELVADLRAQLLLNFEKGAMKPAGIGQKFSYTQNLKIRGDVIYWLEKEHNAAEKAFLERMEHFIEYLNKSCYTGINAYEFHYALYQPGSFYKRHRDQFQVDHGRKFSLITYINDNWGPEDGGELLLYPKETTDRIMPEGGRAVFFKSDEVEHEVLPSNRARLSIAGWLKRIWMVETKKGNSLSFYR